MEGQGGGEAQGVADPQKSLILFLVKIVLVLKNTKVMFIKIAWLPHVSV
jgi:hypothetical protein